MADTDTPSLEEIIELTLSELNFKQSDSHPGPHPDPHPDPIYECGHACIALLPRDPDMCLQVAYEHLHHVPYKEVKTCWRRLYTDAALRQALAVLQGRQ